MRLRTERNDPVDTTGATVPMAAVEADRLPAPYNKPTVTRLQRAGHITQIMYHVIAILVLLGGGLGALAMHFGWLDSWLAEGSPHRPSAQAMFTPVVTSLPTTFLAHDTFQRPDQPLWGKASDGSTWAGEADSVKVFAIAGETGTITGGQGFFDALLGPMRVDAAVQVSASISNFNGGRDNFGAVSRWADDNDYYKAYLDGTHLMVMRRVAGESTVLGMAPFAAKDGTSYTLRFLVHGTQLLARAWETGGTEPRNWMVSVSDNSLSSGVGGIRVLLQTGTIVRVTAFQEQTADQVR
jgi:hypothetical protein